MNILVAARQSPLSQAQIREVWNAIRVYEPAIHFDLLLLESRGDKDLKTSLRDLGKSDFFTKEVDEALLTKKTRIAIHSAKDLPEPLPQGLSIVALTKGVDSSDSLVMREGDCIETLPPGALIATSSIRREETVKALRPDLCFCDIRGTISKRLEKLLSSEADGVVIAEAALIRLNLTHLNRITVPGEVAAYQGQLAIIARSDDEEMNRLFEPLDCREKELYTGLDRPSENLDLRRTHCPFIQIVPLAFDQKYLEELPAYTHILFTSKTAVRLFFAHCRTEKIDERLLTSKTFIVVGKATAKALETEGYAPHLISDNEHAEGLVDTLKRCRLDNAHLFWPHSALARSVLTDFLRDQQIRFTECHLYTTIAKKPEPLPDLTRFDAIFFTSPSTVEAFFTFYPSLPEGKTVHCQGPITKNYFDDLIKSKQSSTMTIINF